MLSSSSSRSFSDSRYPIYCQKMFYDFQAIIPVLFLHHLLHFEFQIINQFVRFLQFVLQLFDIGAQSRALLLQFRIRHNRRNRRRRLPPSRCHRNRPLRLQTALQRADFVVLITAHAHRFVQLRLQAVLDSLLLVAVHDQLVQVVLVLDVQLVDALQLLVAVGQRGAQTLIFAVQLDVLRQGWFGNVRVVTGGGGRTKGKCSSRCGILTFLVNGDQLFDAFVEAEYLLFGLLHCNCVDGVRCINKWLANIVAQAIPSPAKSYLELSTC